MGKVIKKKLNGMSWWAKTSLILLLTMATSVFMYQGWYKPAPAAAATVTYGLICPDSTSTGVDGNSEFITAAMALATAPTVHGNMSTTPTTSGASYRPTTGMTSGTKVTMVRLYSPAYATAQTITAPSGSFAIRGYNASDAWTFHVYKHNPAGAAGNKTLMYSSNSTVSGTGATVVVTPTYTLVDNTMPAGYKLLVEIDYTPGGTVYTPRVYLDGTANTTWCRLTVTETAAATAGSLAVSAATQSVSEGVGNATITVNRTGGSTGAVTVDYATANGTALAGSDYTSTTGTLSWADGDTAAKTITVPIIDDTVDEVDETFTVTLSNATNGATLGTTTQTVTIVDNDVPTVQFQTASSSGSEATTPAVITVTLSATPISNVTVNYTTANGTATAGSDYTATSGTLTITAPATSGTISVPIINDTTSESSETFTVTLSSPTNANLGTNTVHTYTIIDNDGPIATITSCTQCHNGYPSLSDAASRNATPGAFPGSHSVSAHGTDCTVCHVSNSTYDHSNGTIEMAASIRGGSYGKGSSWAATNTPSTLTSCSSTQCHGTASPAWGSAGAGGCATCHSDTTATSSFKTTAGTTTSTSSTLHVSHLNRTHAISTSVITCASCHTVPSAVSDTGHIDSALPAEVIAGLGYASSSCATATCHSSKAPAWTGTMLNSTIADCSKCHDLPPTPGSGSHVKIPAAITTIAGLSACSSLGASGGCHPTINATPSTYANIFADASKHINGVTDGGSCTGCHSVGGSGDINGRTAVKEQFDTAGNSHHVQTTTPGSPVDVKACYPCHWEANSDGTPNTTYHTQTAGQPVNLVLWGTSATRPTGTAVEGTNMVSITSGGTAATPRTELAKINNHCTGCHNNVAKTPFTAVNDSSSPSKYAWDAVDINTKWVQTGTTPWGKFNFSGGTTPVGGTNAKNLVNKAFSAHNNTSGNQTGGAVQTDTTITNISGATAVLCFDCHNSHGSSVAGVTSQYSSATGRNKGGLIKDVAANKGGYVNAYKPVAHTKSGSDTASFSAGATICFDCHNSASGTLTTGYTASGTAPWGYQTFGATAAISGYLDTPYFGAFTMPVATRTPYKAGTANAKALPAGGHFGVTSGLTTAVTKQSHSTTVTAGLQGLCTPCHDPHGVTTNTTFVPTQANAVPLLKGTWVTSPYKEDKADIAVQRGGGSRYAGFTAGGAIPGYHIDQNTLIVQPNPTGSGGATTASARSALRSQKFAPFTNAASSQQTFADTNFAGLCTQCHAKAVLTNATAPSSTNWKTTARIHQSVKGWAATTGTNASNVVHAYTCSKCHAPHTSRLPRLMVTNCLDVNHYKQAVTGGTIPATASGTASGNVNKPATSGGQGRFPSGGALNSNTTAWPTAYNPGPWWFQQSLATGNASTYASTCHNAANAGGTAYNPTNQQWNTKTPW